MIGSTKRALRCVVPTVAVAALAALATSSPAQAARPDKVGNGINTGQESVQLFNYGSYISSGSTASIGANNPIPDPQPTTAAERLERLFEFLQKKGVTSVELFGHAGFPASTDIAGLQAYRALLDRYGLHVAGWHGDVSEANWDQRIIAAKILGADFLGSGGTAAPGQGSYADTLATAATLNRLGKKSVEAGVGPVYIHNHQSEFTTKYVDNGVLKTAWQILMDHTDARYVAAEVDVLWSSDAFQDDTGLQTAALFTDYASRIQMLHIKDGINIAAPVNASPRAVGTGELDFRPILAAAVNRVRYYHQEQDGGSLTDADTSLSNLKGSGPTAVGTMLALPPSFPSVAAGTPAAANVVPVLVQNTGDVPLSITNITVQQNALDAPSASDFAIVSQNCTAAGGGAPLPAGALAVPASGSTPAVPAVPRGTCTVNVGFKPTRSNTTSIARLQFTSNSDSATEAVLLAARSNGDPIVGGVGGDVPGALQLSIPRATGSFGSFVPGVGRSYDLDLAASVTHTAGDASLTVTDTSTTAPGHLVNGSSSLPQPLTARAVGSGGPAPAYAPLSETAGTPLLLRSWSGPTSAEPVTLGFRQAIGATDPLRAGTYAKAVTFTLSTTTP